MRIPEFQRRLLLTLQETITLLPLSLWKRRIKYLSNEKLKMNVQGKQTKHRYNYAQLQKDYKKRYEYVSVLNVIKENTEKILTN